MSALRARIGDNHNHQPDLNIHMKADYIPTEERVFDVLQRGINREEYGGPFQPSFFARSQRLACGMGDYDRCSPLVCCYIFHRNDLRLRSSLS